MSLERLSDEWITRMFEGIRKEVAADISSTVGHPLLGEATKQRVKQLADELTRRGIQFTPIQWTADAQASPPGRRTVRWKASLEAFAALASRGLPRRHP
jgi:hypothetical protein